MATLDDYEGKRDFDRTTEPGPGPAGPARRSLTFVVQKHAARRLHYDFRLEIDGVLKSWPVPKGPSLDPQEKRLAVMVEDHPLDYGAFEGVIAQGSYGAGQVIVWDNGVYSPDEGGALSFGDREQANERMRQGLEAGKLSFTLRGRKLSGSWTLVRTQRSPKDWLLIKHSDEHADPDLDVLEQERSVLSGLTIADLKSGRLPEPAREIGRPAAFPSRLKPMLPSSGGQPFSDPEWLFEPKLDGCRVMAFLRAEKVTLRGGNGKALTRSLPAIVGDLEAQPEQELVIDGEVVALGDDGLPDRDLLHGALDSKGGATSESLIYYVFDVLYLNGRDLRKVALHERKTLLARTLLPMARLKPVEYVDGEGEAFAQVTAGMGLEGMVAKRRDSAYESGVESGRWLEIEGQALLEPAQRRAVTAGLSRAGDARARKDPDKELVGQVLDQLSGDRNDVVLDVSGDRISLTNLDKPLWPEEGGRAAVTKGDMLRYYTRMGPSILPHLRDRPLTLTRYPDGIHGESFYQKRWAHTLPDFVETVRLFSSENDGDVEYIAVNNLPTLVWLAQLADIELHPWISRTVQQPDAAHLAATFTGSKDNIDKSVLNYPDFIVFDLDPYIYSGKEKAGEEPELNRRAFTKAGEVALALKDILDSLSLSSFLKTSGKTGLHVYVPVLRQYEYSVTRKTCELIGRFLMQHRPQEVTMEWSVDRRAGKIFLDHNQNVRSKNMASIYSLRPLPGAPASTPLHWDELGDVYPTDFNIETVPERVEAIGDLWADVHEAKHDLRRLLELEQ